MSLRVHFFMILTNIFKLIDECNLMLKSDNLRSFVFSIENQ